MDPDLFLVVGLGVGMLAIPSLLSAYSESRAPRAGAILALISGALLAVALTIKPGGYSMAEVPDVIYRVIARVIN